MKWPAAVLAVALAGTAAGQTADPSKNSPGAPTSKEAQHRNDDVARHRLMARAHEEAARCLESGTAEKQCHARLREMCKGIAVGQYCGMRHGH